MKFGSEQILFSDRVTSDSQILYDRDPQTRVKKVAPYLTLDSRVYPAVVDNKRGLDRRRVHHVRPVPVLHVQAARAGHRRTR